MSAPDRFVLTLVAILVFGLAAILGLVAILR